MFRKDRKKGGGGLMAFISTNVEVLPIEIKTTCSTILLVGVYRPPKAKGKKKVKSLYLTSVVPSATRLVLMKADGAPSTPLPLSVLRFTGIQSYDSRIRGKSKQTLKSLKIEPETSRSESRALAN